MKNLQITSGFIRPGGKPYMKNFTEMKNKKIGY